MRLSVRSSSTSARSKSPVKRSRVTRSGSSASSKTKRRRLRRLRLRLDLLPELHQELEVELDVLGRGALGGGADDHAALLGGDLLDDVPQAVALVLLEPARDAEALAVRDEDDEAAGQRDLGRQPRALRLHRVLDRLDEHLLAAADQVGDPAAARAAALELGADDLVDEQEAVLLEADLDERRLHPRQDVVDDALVDVPGDRAALGPLEVDLGDAIVLEDGDALLGDVDRDEQLALRGRQRRAARRLAAAGVRAAAGGRPAWPRPSAPSAAVALRRRASVAAAVFRRRDGGRRAGFRRFLPPRLPRRRFGFAASPVSGAAGGSCC